MQTTALLLILKISINMQDKTFYFASPATQESETELKASSINTGVETVTNNFEF